MRIFERIYDRCMLSTDDEILLDYLDKLADAVSYYSC